MADALACFDEDPLFISAVGDDEQVILRMTGRESFSVAVKGIFSTRIISVFHSKSLYLVTIIFDLSKVTVPEE